MWHSGENGQGTSNKPLSAQLPPRPFNPSSEMKKRRTGTFNEALGNVKWNPNFGTAGNKEAGIALLRLGLDKGSQDVRGPSASSQKEPPDVCGPSASSPPVSASQTGSSFVPFALQNATADSRSVQNPPVQRTAGGHPLPIMDKDDLEAGEQDNGNPIMDALQSWSAWPDFIKETLDPSETSKALARQKQSRSTSSTGPDTSPDIDLMYVIPASMHGKHGSALGKIHTIDPVETSRTLCGWYYERFNSETHIFSTTPFPSENVAIEGASKCSSCTRCEEQRSL